MKRIFLPLFVFLCALWLVKPVNLSFEGKWLHFSMIPVLHEGRIKPLDTLARLQKQRIDADDLSAEAWMAETLFTPLRSVERRQFPVPREEIRNLLELPERTPPVYSFSELAPLLDQRIETISSLTSQKQLTKSQQDLLDLYATVVMHGQLVQALTALLPLSIRIPQTIVPKNEQEFDKRFNYLEMYRYKKKSDKLLAEIIKNKKKNIDNYSAAEKEVVSFSYQMLSIEEAGRQNTLLRTIPAQNQRDKQEWLSIWNFLNAEKIFPSDLAFLDSWKQMAIAYIENNDMAFEEFSEQALKHALLKGNLDKINLLRLKAEVLYNTVNPFKIALVFYILSICLIAARINEISRAENAIPNYYYAAWTGIIFHLIGLTARVFILSRPPVGTLYESLLFVSLLCPLVGLFLFKYNPQIFILLGGTISAAFLLAITPAFDNSADTFEMLTAVLNTNFWLGTHVLCITAGYGASLLAGTLAHIRLAELAFGEKNKISVSDNMLHAISLMALLLMALGTMLGGIWADQSWGRFWGWDPKENGALLIILWLLWLLHGRLAGALKPLSYAALLAFINVIVALSWFGVNLLSVGLHSYGFISGIAVGLMLFCLIEIMVISAFWWVNRKSL